MFNPSRLKLARTRRHLTLKSLAIKIDLNPKTVAEYEALSCSLYPTKKTIQAISQTLDYPEAFLFSEENVVEINVDNVSFRSLTSMKAAQKHAALASCSIGVMLNHYFYSRFNLPDANIPDLSKVDPELAAEVIRDEWDLGVQSVSHCISLLEKHGVRVFSLDEDMIDIDSFSFWNDAIPYVFLNTHKSGERSRFDAAHELGHLILHRNEIPQGRNIEKEADCFASFFLMPKDTILPLSGQYYTLQQIIDLKRKWKVSVLALMFHMKNLNILNDFQFKTLILNASKLGLRLKEIEEIPKEKSKLIQNLLDTLKKKGVMINDIANVLYLPYDEVRSLLFVFGVLSGKSTKSTLPRSPNLRLVTLEGG